jgi:GIY-YIG catalytic domain-containing protein
LRSRAPSLIPSTASFGWHAPSFYYASPHMHIDMRDYRNPLALKQVAFDDYTLPQHSGEKIMYYVYLLESESSRGQRYTGFTEDLRKRLAAHNAGQSTHTRPGIGPGVWPATWPSVRSSAPSTSSVI